MNEEEAIQILKNMNIEISGTSTYKECIYDDETRCFRDGKDCQIQAIETVLNLLEKKDIDIIEAKEANRQLSVELQKKDKIIDEIQKEVRDHIGFENRLKRDNKEPDLFNQGRFYVANNINNITKGK